LREKIASLKRKRVSSSDASGNATATFVNGEVYGYRWGNVPGQKTKIVVSIFQRVEFYFEFDFGFII